MTFLLGHTPVCTWLDPCPTCRAHKILVGKKLTEPEIKLLVDLAAEFAKTTLPPEPVLVPEPVVAAVAAESEPEPMITPAPIGPNLAHLNGHKVGLGIWAKSTVAPPPPEPLRGHLPSVWQRRG